MNAGPLEQQASAPPSAGQRSFPGLIIREHQPENLEFPFSSLNSSLTPNEQFFVRSHFSVPKIELKDWNLRVEGRTVAKPAIEFMALVANEVISDHAI